MACGEYGENNTKRPHYHAIIFNGSAKLIREAWGTAIMKNNEVIGYDSWGLVDVQMASLATLAYVVKYLDKKRGQRNDQWKRPKEFRLNSGKMGLEYLKKNKQWHKDNPEVMYCQKGNFMIPMPRYYREKIWNEEERGLQLEKMIDNIEEVKQKAIKLIGGIEKYNDNLLRQRHGYNTKFEKKKKKRKDL